MARKDGIQADLHGCEALQPYQLAISHADSDEGIAIAATPRKSRLTVPRPFCCPEGRGGFSKRIVARPSCARKMVLSPQVGLIVVSLRLLLSRPRPLGPATNTEHMSGSGPQPHPNFVEVWGEVAAVSARAGLEDAVCSDQAFSRFATPAREYLRCNRAG